MDIKSIDNFNDRVLLRLLFYKSLVGWQMKDAKLYNRLQKLYDFSNVGYRDAIDTYLAERVFLDIDMDKTHIEVDKDGWRSIKGRSYYKINNKGKEAIYNYSFPSESEARRKVRWGKVYGGYWDVIKIIIGAAVGALFGYWLK